MILWSRDTYSITLILKPVFLNCDLFQSLKKSLQRNSLQGVLSFKEKKKMLSEHCTLCSILSSPYGHIFNVFTRFIT